MIAKHKLDPQLQWFPQARYGMFIHFGVYALLGRGEWVMLREDIRREEYVKLMRRFNPHRFDADQWVQSALDCGCRYMTVTAKHHDGFCMFDSALTDYKITNTPFGRDLIGELIGACQRRKLPIALYYSQPDWHHPNFIHRPQAFKDLQYERPEDTPNWPRYLEYYIGQVEELCTNYGRIDGIWFDGVQRTEKEWQGRQVYEMIKRHQPHAIVNDRAGYGDIFTPERSLAHLAAAAGYTVEACQSVAEKAWGYRRETPLYSTPYLLHSLLRTVGAGANYLLNVGPKPDGTLPEPWLERMRGMGEWLRANGKSVYGTQGCPLQGESDDLVYTRRGSTVYLHVLRWPQSDQLELSRLRVAPVSARMLGARGKLSVEQTEDAIIISGLPASPPSPAASVIEMRFDGENVFHPAPTEPKPEGIRAGKSRRISLPAAQAELTGFGFKGSVLTLQRLSEMEAAITSQWTPEQSATWRVQAAPGRYSVAVELACPAPFDGTSFEVRVGDEKLTAAVPDTGGQFALVDAGEIALPDEETTVRLRPVKPNYAPFFARIKGIVLKRV